MFSVYNCINIYIKLKHPRHLSRAEKIYKDDLERLGYIRVLLGISLEYQSHVLRQARSRQVTSSILRILSVIEIPGSMYMIFQGAPRENLFLIYVLS